MFRVANCKEQIYSGEPEQKDKTEWEWEGGPGRPRAGAGFLPSGARRRFAVRLSPSWNTGWCLNQGPLRFHVVLCRSCGQPCPEL